MNGLTIPAIISLALIDAINPCAIAVLGLLIIAYMTHNPKEKKRALLAGLLFIAAVYLLYLVYGVLIVHVLGFGMGIFEGSELLIYGLFSLLAIALGVFNIKDFFWYRPGGLLREMPMKWRPHVQKILNGIETPKGGFFLGIFVTLFLLPCTIGPLLMAATMLAKYGVFAAVPWLILYNAIFVIPMVAIVLGIYAGLTMVENVTQWKDRNIKYLHLVAGAIMAAIGLYLAWEAENAFHFLLGPLDLNFFTIGIAEIPILLAVIWFRHKKG